MLQSLRIKNLALLEEVALDFEAGFTAVTGETGAGKSILLGALSLLAGERADKTIIRQGAAACEAEAALFFEDPARIDAVLAGLDLPPCEEGVLILKRSLSRDKAPKITVNGSLAALSTLQRLGEHWVDFHGPNEPRRLLKESCQLELLDLYGRSGEALARYQQQYRAWREIVAERERVAHETKLSPDQIDFLQNQLARLEALELTEEAIGALERDFARMSGAQELIGLAQGIEAGLVGDEGVQARVAALLREARQLENLDTASKPLADRLASLAVELNDLGAEFSALGEQLQFDPEAAEAHMHLLLQVFGLADRGPFVGAAADQAALGRDMHLRIGRERFSDQLFGDVWPVAVSRVDEVDAELRHAAQGALALLRMLRRPPDSLAGDAHGTEPEAVDIHVAANGECSRTGGIGCGHGKTPRISIAT